MARIKNWVNSVKPFIKKPLLATFLFGISSGFPLTLVFSLISGWLKRSGGISKSEIGLFALIGLAYMLKFLWAPLIDGIKLGRFERWLGHRRSWLVLIIGLMVPAILYLGTLDPTTQLWTVAMTALVIAILSASQDIVIDAYRIEIVKDEELGHGAAMINYGYRTGAFAAGYFGLILAELYSWQFAFTVLAGFAVSGLIAAFWMGEPMHIESEKRDTSYADFFHDSVYMPLKEFMQRDSWLIIVLFVMFLKIGDVMADFMMMPFHMELGFSNIEIANYSKTVGLITMLVGIGIGAIMYHRLGVYLALFVSTILMMVTNLVFIWAFYQGYDTTALGVSVGAEKFATGVGSTVVVAYLSSLCNRSFTATQYALLSSLAGVGRTFFGSAGGFVVDGFGWVNFFIITTVAAVPGLLLLMLLWRRQIGSEAKSVAQIKNK